MVGQEDNHKQKNIEECDYLLLKLFLMEQNTDQYCIDLNLEMVLAHRIINKQLKNGIDELTQATLRHKKSLTKPKN